VQLLWNTRALGVRVYEEVPGY
jgi:hypothetical protein